MKSNIDLSIVIPSINPSVWLDLFSQLSKTIVRYNFELICVGPFFPTKELESYHNFLFIKDYGCPSRCFQLGSTIANGKYLAFISDDCMIEQTFDDCINFMNSYAGPEDGMNLLYSEGPGYTGSQDKDPGYWRPYTHGALRLRHVRPDWNVATCFLYRTDFFRHIGGLNCQFEHVNMNSHDLAFRAQRKGTKIHQSPRKTHSADWHPWESDESKKGPIQLSFEQNDMPLFKKIYQDTDEEPPIFISYDNWRNVPNVWPRRFITK